MFQFIGRGSLLRFSLFEHAFSQLSISVHYCTYIVKAKPCLTSTNGQIWTCTYTVSHLESMATRKAKGLTGFSRKWTFAMPPEWRSLSE